MRTLLRWLLPFLLVAAGAGVVAALVAMKPEAPKREAGDTAPLVRTVEVRRGPHTYIIESQGTVLPRTQTALASELDGRVTEVSPALATGGFFERDDVLVKLERTEYAAAVEEARAAVADAELQLARERADAEVARRDWADSHQGEAPPLGLHEPQVRMAEAALNAARARLEVAETDLERTEVRAPYAGRVRTKNVDVGQYVTRGTMLAQIYAVDVAEVRLPVADDALAYLDVPVAYRGESVTGAGVPARLTARFAGGVHTWPARVVRSEGLVDPATRLVTLVARMDNPYGKTEAGERPPLQGGIFVQAEVTGRTEPDAAVVPREALRRGDRVWLARPDGMLEIRDVEVLRRTADTVVIGAGLADGDHVIVSPLEAVVDGMAVARMDDGGTDR